jgi:hypothetical protein
MNSGTTRIDDDFAARGFETVGVWITLGATKRGEITLLVPRATPDEAFIELSFVVRDLEVGGSNPLAPTTSTLIFIGLHIERLRFLQFPAT